MGDKIGLRQIETFYYAAKLGSFSKAADAMRVSQPTVSEHIAHLERVLGVVLFDRSSRRVTLTDAGRIYYDYCQKIVRLREEAHQAIEELKGLLRGRLLLGASTIPGTYILPELVARFHKRFPQIETEVRISDSTGVEEGILKGECQLGFIGRKPRGRGLEAVEFAEDEVVVVSAQPLRTITLQELKEMDFVAREIGSATQSVFESALAEAGLDPRRLKIVARFGSSESLKKAVIKGLGIGAISRLAVADDLSARRLHEVKIADLSIRRNFYMIYQRRGSVSPAAREFVRLVRST